MTTGLNPTADHGQNPPIGYGPSLDSPGATSPDTMHSSSAAEQDGREHATTAPYSPLLPARLGRLALAYFRNVRAQFGYTVDRWMTLTVQLHQAMEEYHQYQADENHITSTYAEVRQPAAERQPAKTIPLDQVEAFLSSYRVAMPNDLLATLNQGPGRHEIIVYGIVDKRYPALHAAERAKRELRWLSQQIGMLLISIFSMPDLEQPRSKRQPTRHEPRDIRQDLPEKLRPQRGGNIKDVGADPLGVLTQRHPDLKAAIIEQAGYDDAWRTPGRSRPKPGMNAKRRRDLWNELRIDGDIEALRRPAMQDAPDAMLQQKIATALEVVLQGLAPNASPIIPDETTAQLTKQQRTDFEWIRGRIVSLIATEEAVGALIKQGVDIRAICLSIAASALQQNINRETISQSVQAALLALGAAQLPRSASSQDPGVSSITAA